MKRRDFLKGITGMGLFLVAISLESQAAPGGGSSPDYAMIIDLERCMGCESCSVACHIFHGAPENSFNTRIKTIEYGNFPFAQTAFFPILCNQCHQAPCIKACPSGAIRRRPDGIVVTDWDICEGLGLCVEACPFGARHVDPRFGGKSSQCNFCIQRVLEGMMPVCVETCPSRARLFGDLSDPKGEFASYLNEKEIFQLSFQKGIEGRVFYAGNAWLATRILS